MRAQVAPNPFTPNNDGINDVARISYDLLRVVAPVPVRVELYDLARDLGETHNLAAQRPDLVRDLCDELQRWRQSIGARMSVPNPAFDPNRADLFPDLPMIPIPSPPKRLP